MARYIARARNERSESTRTGNNGITTEANGWASGVRVVGRPQRDDPDTDHFDIYATSGSGFGASPVKLGALVGGEFILAPQPKKEEGK